MEFNIEALSAEDIEPLAKAMTLLPPERRGEVYFRIQNAAREFLAKAAAGTPPASASQTDPIRKTVFGALEKQLPAPAPTLDPLKREALGTLEKAVLAGARAALGSAMVSGGGLMLTDWLIIGAVPLAGVVLALVTARITIAYALKAML